MYPLAGHRSKLCPDGITRYCDCSRHVCYTWIALSVLSEASFVQDTMCLGLLES